jgi:hypothetical protein
MRRRFDYNRAAVFFSGISFVGHQATVGTAPVKSAERIPNQDGWTQLDVADRPAEIFSFMTSRARTNFITILGMKRLLVG